MTLKEWLKDNPCNLFETKGEIQYGKNNYFWVITEDNSYDGFSTADNKKKAFLDWEIVKITDEDIIIKEPVEKQPDYFKIPEFKERCQKILEHYGTKLQIIQTIQEMSELTKELTNEYKQIDDLELATNRIQPNPFILDELVDVYIMLQQIKLSFDINEYEMGKKINEKLTRQIKRIENEKV